MAQLARKPAALAWPSLQLWMLQGVGCA